MSLVSQKDMQARYIEEYAILRKTCASAIAMGLFYQRGLDEEVWSSQAEIARSLCVSKGYVSKALQAATLPSEIVSALGGQDRISFREAAALERVIRLVGAEKARARASMIGDGPPRRIDEVISLIVSGHLLSRTGQDISIRVSRTGKFLKIESMQMEKLIANLPRIERLLTMLF